VEVSALSHSGGMPALRGPSALLRLQSDERLIALTRRGHHAAFETLCTRYQSRLLSFCRHMLASREDAEDVLQEVYAAAFNAILADERDINVRPWLYRIARNRSLNHLRRATATGVDSMDVHFAEQGISTGEKVLRRESFRELIADVHELAETQRTALLLREIDALSYEQIAQAMETTVPSVKSLLVRARISLAEAAEARKLSCEEVRLELGEVAEGLTKLGTPARRHVRGCERCAFFKKQLKDNNHALAMIMPVGPLLLIKKVLLAKLGSTASAGGAHAAHVAGGAGATVGAGATAGVAATGGAGFAGGIMTAGAGALATKAVAGLAAAAIVTAGAVAADHAVVTPHRHHPSHATASTTQSAAYAHEPVVVTQQAQPVSVGAATFHRRATVGVHHRTPKTTKIPLAKPTLTAAATAPTGVPTATPATPATQPAATAVPLPPPTQVTEVTTQTTQLPPQATTPPTATTPTSTGTTATPPPSAATPPSSLPTAEPVPVPESHSPGARGGSAGSSAGSGSSGASTAGSGGTEAPAH
jgi:RNA polymerase sigma factor (sigma-70 family)